MRYISEITDGNQRGSWDGAAMIAEPIKEYGMDFGEYERNDLFRMEKLIK
jgi:hypothetical protein